MEYQPSSPIQAIAAFIPLIQAYLITSAYHTLYYKTFFCLRTTEKTLLVEMCIWCIKIGIVLVLHFNPWVEASAGGLLVPKGLFSPVAKYFGTCFKVQI
jgi:hypothetical protein